jgi:hypothetical protein
MFDILSWLKPGDSGSEEFHCWLLMTDEFLQL